jgi:hypothetical protein
MSNTVVRCLLIFAFARALVLAFAGPRYLVTARGPGSSGAVRWSGVMTAEEAVARIEGPTYDCRRREYGSVSIPFCQCGRRMVDPPVGSKEHRDALKNVVSGLACPLRSMERGHDTWQPRRGFRRGRA